MKIKIGLLVGYNGESFHGSQYNLDLKTVELSITKALLEAKAIKEQNASDPGKIGIQRGSRTDKGVHAATSLITCRIECAITSELTKKLKSILKDHKIHLYNIIRLPNGFNPKKKCQGRTYEYLIPTFIFDNTFMLEYKIDDNTYIMLKTVLQKYIGTRHYHNFTQASNTKGAQRYIRNIEVSEPYEHEGIEYLKITISGNSFMIHQIRKMMGFAVALIRFQVKDHESIFESAFEEKAINIPKAPSEFLLLESQDYSFYNKSPMYEPVYYDEDEKTMVKNTLIYPTVLKKENLDVFKTWFSIFEKHDYDFTYLK